MATESPSERKTLTVEEAAKVLGIGRGLAYEAVRRGEIPTVRIGRRMLVPRTALERLLAGAGEYDEHHGAASTPESHAA